MYTSCPSDSEEKQLCRKFIDILGWKKRQALHRVFRLDSSDNRLCETRLCTDIKKMGGKRYDIKGFFNWKTPKSKLHKVMSTFRFDPDVNCGGFLGAGDLVFLGGCYGQRFRWWPRYKMSYC